MTHTIAFDWRQIAEPLAKVQYCETELSLATLVLRNPEVQQSFQPGLALFRVKLHSYTRLTAELAGTVRLLKYITKGMPIFKEPKRHGPPSYDSILKHEDMEWIIYHVKALE